MLDPSTAARLTDLGSVMQIAFMSADLASSLKFWTETLGVGPFFLRERVVVERTLYKGKDIEIDFTMALSYWGNIQIELVRQNDSTPSVYTEWRRRRPHGPHHVGVMVEDMPAARRALEQMGAEVLQEVTLVDGRGEAIYADMHWDSPMLLEIIQASPAAISGFDQIRAVASAWNGNDPLRYL